MFLWICLGNKEVENSTGLSSSGTNLCGVTMLGNELINALPYPGQTGVQRLSFPIILMRARVLGTHEVPPSAQKPRRDVVLCPLEE